MIKNIFLFVIAVSLFTSCENKDKRYTQQSPEIDTVKQLISNYNNKNYDISMYADTSKTSYNMYQKSLTPEETIAYHKANDQIYASRGFIEKDQEYEMVVTDDGKTWVNFWSDWKGTLAGNNQEIFIPIHLTYQFIDGKIVRESGYWNASQVMLAQEKVEKDAADMSDIEDTSETDAN